MVLDQACARVGLASRGAELIRMVDNAVFRIARHQVVIRISLTDRQHHRAKAAVTTAGLLAAHGVPAVAVLPEAPTPLQVRGHTVTFWQEVPDTGRQPRGTDLAGLLLRMHHLPTRDTGLPGWDPIGDLRDRLAATDAWDPTDVDFLLHRCDEVAARLAGLRYALPPGVVHGDAHLGNLIPTPGGAVLCDFDTTCIGPREWDLVPIAVGALRVHRSPHTHQRLAAAYGFDVTAWDGFPVLRELRELQITGAVLPTAGANPSISPELRRRLRCLRAGDTFTRWTAYR